MDESELCKIIDDLRGLEQRFSASVGNGEPALSSVDRVNYKRLVLEAKGLIDEGLGALNDFAMPLFRIALPPNFGVLSRPSLEDILEAIALAEGGLNQLRRKNNRTPARSAGIQKSSYVSPTRIIQLRSGKARQWDLQRLIRMLEELNYAHEYEAHITTAMLVRAITDHVPPIFGIKSFSEVANNYPGGKSFGEQMKHLDSSLRRVADGLLHQQVRRSEALPQGQQVDFRAALDSLLSEVIRVLE